MTVNKIGALIPIRLASERLPNKALLPICGRPIVWHILDRVCASRYVERKHVVVCTTMEKSDDPLVAAVESYGCTAYRGSTDDIIKRFHDAMAYFDFDTVIQVDGDDVLCDTLYMDLTMERLLSDPTFDIVTCGKLPLGIASKSFTRRGMENVFRRYKSEKNDTGFIYFFTKTGLCKQDIIDPIKEDHICDEVRLTLDYKEDYELFSKIFEALYSEGRIFSLDEVLTFLRSHPQVMNINGNLNEEYWQRTREKAQLTYQDVDGHVKKIK